MYFDMTRYLYPLTNSLKIGSLAASLDFTTDLTGIPSSFLVYALFRPRL